MKKKIILKLERKVNKVGIYIKVPKEIEEYFKNISNSEVKTSACWKYKNNEGARFYALTDEYAKLERQLSYDAFNDYGDGLIKDGRINLALLRTEGASEGVFVWAEKFLPVDNIDLEYYIRELGKIAKMIWEKFISPKKIKAIITFEI